MTTTTGSTETTTKVETTTTENDFSSQFEPY